MPEYFIVANSFAAPFVSDKSESFHAGDTPESALTGFAQSYSHPAGLYAAEIYADANAYHKGEKPLARWLCNHEAEMRAITKDKGSYSYLGRGPGDFEIDGERYRIDDPKGGKLVDAA